MGFEGYPPGHFYSPVVDVDDPCAIRAVRERTSAPLPAGIGVDAAGMLRTMERLARHRSLFPFPREAGEEFRFYWDNPFFGCHDASVYFSMLLEFRPRRVVEVGCGFSSRLLLDTRDRFGNAEMEITLIDPQLETMLADLRAARAELLNSKLQDTPLALFERLEENDILFLDSSHVSKTGSDVNFYLFEILPRLRSGVLIHIHDILYPFEYLEEWVLDEKRSWNEAYAVRAFLEYNSDFEILYWNNYAFHRLHENLRELMPLCLGNEGGSLWLRRVRG